MAQERPSSPKFEEIDKALLDENSTRSGLTPSAPLVGRLGFVVIAHDQPENVRRLVRRLLEQDAVVALHWDARNPMDLGGTLKNELPKNLSPRFLSARRVKVEWGLWTVVEATLCGLEALEASGIPLSHVTLLSGHDYPLRPLEQLKRFLEAHPGIEHIEAIDHEKEKWVTDGLHDERWQYRHFTSWRDNPGLFDRIWHLQRDLGWKVTPPEGIKPHFGSQWWTLSWPTIVRILELSKNPPIRKFFRRTWVPDEMFFQTMVAKVVPKANISGYNLNFYHFNKNGVPLVFHADHLDFLAAQPHFFARKIAPRGQLLRDRLEELAASRIGAPPPCVPIKKNLAQYEYFSALQYHGIPNRRVMGSQRDLWWGDMECNKRPYTAILAPEKLDLSEVFRPFLQRPRTICYGDLFRSGHIDYGPHARPHPLYPQEANLLRDLKKPNFLFDLIQSHPEAHLVFSMRLPFHTEMPQIVVADPHCEVVFVMVEQPFWNPEVGGKLRWEAPCDQLILNQLYWKARKNGKKCPILTPPFN